MLLALASVAPEAARAASPAPTKPRSAVWPDTSLHTGQPAKPTKLNVAGSAGLASASTGLTYEQLKTQAGTPVSNKQVSSTTSPGGPLPLAGGAGGAMAAMAAPGTTETIVYSIADGCADTNKILCRHRDVSHIWASAPFVANAGQVISIATSDLTPSAGAAGVPCTTGGYADTVIFLLRCDDSACTSGQLAAADDDGNAGAEACASLLNHTPATTGTYRVLVSSFQQGGEGTADIWLTYNNTAQPTVEDQRFGGYHVRNVEVRAGDTMLVGKDPDDSETWGLPGQPDYHDSTLTYIGATTLNCGDDSGGPSCGAAPFHYNDDAHVNGTAVTRLSRIIVPTGSATTFGRVMVGVWHPGDCLASVCGTAQPYKMNARLLRLRKASSQGGSWTHADAVDADGDGLPRELEVLLGTCDNDTDASHFGVGVRGFGCPEIKAFVNDYVEQGQWLEYQTRKRMPGVTNNPYAGACSNSAHVDNGRCWSPQDSDNDGLRDDMEVWAAVYGCTQVPQAPFFDPGTCTPMAVDATTNSTSFLTSMALSAETDPDPTVYDIFVQIDHWLCDSSSTATPDWCTNSDPDLSHDLTSGQWSRLQQIFDRDAQRCWDGTDSGTDRCLDTENEPIEGLDNRYMFRIHRVLEQSDSVYVPADRQSHELTLADTSVTSEVLYGGATMVSQHLLHNSWGPLVFARLGRLALMTRLDGGQATYIGHSHLRPRGPGVVVGNSAYSAYDGWRVDQNMTDLAHELGHTLQLDHPHGAETDDYCDASGAQAPCASSVHPNATSCAGPVRSIWHNPLHTSIMSYNYPRAMSATTTTMPGNTPHFTDCNRSDARFSKGWLPTLSEATVSETLDGLAVADAGRWQRVVAAREMACVYENINYPDGWNMQEADYGWRSLGAGGTRLAPYCDASACYVNWDGDGASPAAPYAADLDFSRYDPAMQMCTAEVIRDSDDFRRMLALGRMLPNGWDGWRYEVVPYVDLFNTDQQDNITGWNVGVVSDAQRGVRDDAIEVNRCASDSDCGALPNVSLSTQDNCTQATEQSDCVSNLCGVGDVCTCTTDAQCQSGQCRDGQCRRARSCIKDTCTSNAQCQSGECSSCVGGTCSGAQGVCKCNTNEHCRSGACGAGECRIDKGHCECLVANDCALGLSCAEFSTYLSLPPRVCAVTDPTMSAKLPVGAPAFHGGLLFDGTKSHQLKHGVGPSPLDAINENKAFRLAFDFRWDGFATGEDEQVLAHSGAFELRLLEHGGSGGVSWAKVEASVVPTLGSPVVLSSASLSGMALQPGRWYRLHLYFYLGSHTFGFDLRRLLATTGRWESMPSVTSPPLAERRCVRQDLSQLTPVPTALAPVSDVTLGNHGTATGVGFRGAIDNVELAGYANPAQQFPLQDDHTNSYCVSP